MRKSHKTLVYRVLLLLLIFASWGCTEVEAQKVYITKTGEKYHRSNCRYLRYSRLEVKLSEARKNGYTPCSVCRPGATEKEPKQGAGNTQTPSAPKQVTPLYKKSAPAKTTARQCTAITKAGSRCKRTTTNANGRCFQHQ